MKTSLSSLLTAVLLAASCGPATSVEASKEASKNDKERKPAPSLALPDDKGQTVRLSDYKGKVVLLDFWATWCGPCKIEIPWFIEFQRKYKDKGFSVVSVAMDEDGWKVIRPFAREYKMNYPILLGNDEATATFGGVGVLPTTFIIDRQGRIVEMHEGLVSKGSIENAIKSLL